MQAGGGGYHTIRYSDCYKKKSKIAEKCIAHKHQLKYIRI